MSDKILFTVESKKVNEEISLTFDELRDKYGFASGDEKDLFYMKILQNKIVNDYLPFIDLDLEEVHISYEVIRE